MRAGPGRAVIRASLPVDLLDELGREAERRGISIEELVDLLLVEHLPTVLAEEAGAHLRSSLAIANRHAVNSPNTANAEMAPALAEATPNPRVPQPQVTPSLPPGDLDAEDVSGDTARRPHPP